VATAKFKHNGEVLSEETGRLESTRVYVVLDALSAADARQATGLPQPGSPHPDYEEISARHYTVRPIDRGNGQYEVEVVYLPPGGSIPPPTAPYLRWDIGTQTQDVQVGLDGLPLGCDSIWDAQKGAWVEDDQFAGWGAPVFVPTLDFEYVLPELPQPPVAGYFSLTGRVNRDEMSIGGAVFPPDSVQYMGAVIEPGGDTMSRVYQVTHRFRAGAMALPHGIPVKYIADGQWANWTLPYVPLAYAVIPVWETAEPTAEEPFGRRVSYIYLSRVYEAADLSPLFQWPPPPGPGGG